MHRNPPPLRIAILGCGAISELYYTPALREMCRAGTVEITAVFDPDARQTAKLQSHFPGSAPVNRFADLSRHPVDLGIVASPPRFHAEQAIALLEQGIPVLCEKPMAATLAEAEKMLEAVAKAPRPLLAVGLFRRFFAANRTIREIVQKQLLGPVRRFEISEGYPFDWPAQSASFFKKSGSQGGVLADLGVHVLDLLIWWFGMPDKVACEDDAMGGLEANCRLQLGFPGGITGTVRLSRDTPLPNRTFIECERGWLRCNAASADQLELGFDGVAHSLKGSLASFDSAPAPTYSQSFLNQLLNVAAAVRGEEPLFIPGDQGILSLRLIEQCSRERKLMPMPWLSPGEWTRAQELSQLSQSSQPGEPTP